jgi:outer membrane protein TolC
MTTHPVHSNGTCPHRWCRAHAHPSDVAPADDDTVRAARRAVAIARQRVTVVRRKRMRGEVGNADVHQAEADLSRALDRLEHVNVQRQVT